MIRPDAREISQSAATKRQRCSSRGLRNYPERIERGICQRPPPSARPETGLWNQLGLAKSSCARMAAQFSRLFNSLRIPLDNLVLEDRRQGRQTRIACVASRSTLRSDENCSPSFGTSPLIYPPRPQRQPIDIGRRACMNSIPRMSILLSHMPDCILRVRMVRFF